MTGDNGNSSSDVKVHMLYNVVLLSMIRVAFLKTEANITALI